MTRVQLLNFLIAEAVLKTPAIINAFRVIDRADFIPQELQTKAYHNVPLPIGQGQTISQPLTVALMLEWLAPKAGDIILDVGSGSGWQTALLAHIISENKSNSEGKVYGLEIIPQLASQSVKNISQYNFIESKTAEINEGSAQWGFKKGAPFNGIIAAASIIEPEDFEGDILKIIPLTWRQQLRIGGHIVVPIGHSIWLLNKLDKNNFNVKEYPGFSFVPFIKNRRVSR